MSNEYEFIHEYRLEYLKKAILSLGLPKGSRVLDVGCYPPNILNFLEKEGFETWGVASEHEKIDRENVRVLNIETEKFPWKDKFFDLIIFTEILEHLPHDPQIPMKDMYRVLKSGGNIIVTTPNIVRLHNRLKMIAGKSIMYPLDQQQEVTPGNGSIYHLHHKEYTLEEVSALLKRTGFTIDEAKQVCMYPPTRKKVQAEPIKSKAIKWAGFGLQQLHTSFKDTLFVIGKK
jgi:2-polyprenyl-3-methyl-5-hydroxy-6-metoxy-1,4-benzoquinol methylase